MPQWIEVTISVTPENEEAIANALWELGTGGVVQSGGEGAGASEQLTGFLPDHPDLNEKIGRIHGLWENLRSLGLASGDCPVTTRSVSEEDWSGKWKTRVVPVRVTDRLMVAPPWSEVRGKEGLLVIRINPGTGFGTGGHETTQLCLRLLEKHVRSGDRVLDIGSGSGVLCIAAVLLGASRATGIDIDPETIGNARENITLNGVAERVEVHAGRMDHPAVKGRYRIIVSNISAASLSSLLPVFARRLQPGGRLILSGLLDEEAADFETTLEDRGYSLLERERQELWWAGTACLASG